MATLATQGISRAGLVATFAAASAGGDKFTPSKDTTLRVDNGSGASVTVTVASPWKNPIGQDSADVVVAVAAGATADIGPFPAEYFANPADNGLASVSYSSAASVQVAALAVQQP